MISILTPTHRRPELAKRMLDSVRENSIGPVECIFYIDEDDPCMEEYKSLSAPAIMSRWAFFNDSPVSVMTMTGLSDRVGKLWNEMANEAHGEWLMMGNDDLVFCTPGWDEIIQNELNKTFPDNIGVGYCNDGGPNAAHQCAFPIVGLKWTEVLGYFTPEHFHFLWNDTWIRDIAKMIGRLHYIPQVLVEHCHFTYRKAEFDETYKKHRTGSSIVKRHEDERRYGELHLERQRDAERIRQHVQ